MERDAMSLTDLMADFLSADRKPVIEADPSGAGPSCLNSSPDSDDERHSESFPAANLKPGSSTDQATLNQGEKAERVVVSTKTGTHLKPALPKKAKIYTAVIDGKEVTLIDTNALPVDEFIQGVRKRFGIDRIGNIKKRVV